ncbi:hypothetical protein PMAL9190_02298 [Photobacterium malacitanum]|uniref:Nickel uptake substrate-specific transmembrane region n=1 Tax=Photobacterium malacitanum TaxID=2204294 RepID=A0A1Y6MIJ1_9GAMM|nr:hypothetical protein PMAL9190_02298 [Photobacterium malacitanum]
MRRNVLCSFMLSIAALSPITSQAHPHSWIDMKTYIEGNNNQITGFKMVWTFDAMTTAYMLDGEDMSPKNKQKTLKNIAASVMENMKNEHYFTYFYDNETPIKYHIPAGGELIKPRAKATLTFELPLAKPKTVTKDSLKLLIFEPSYYVDMSWGNKSDIVLSPELAKTCSFKLIEPHPTPEQVTYAMSIPADESPDPDDKLGQVFTQTVKLYCNVDNALPSTK